MTKQNKSAKRGAKSRSATPARAKRQGSIAPPPPPEDKRTIAPHTLVGEVTRASLRRKVQMARAYRQNIIAHLYLSSAMTQEQIAEYLDDVYGVKVSSVTVNHDLVDLRKAWEHSAAFTAQTAREREIAKLDQLELSALELSELMPKAFISLMLKIATRRAKLLGLDKPLKLDIQDRRTSDLSDEELEKLATKLEREVEKEEA